jgi:hypothetical protein
MTIGAQFGFGVPQFAKSCKVEGVAKGVHGH